MTDTFSILSYLTTFIYLLGEILVFIASIVLVSKDRSALPITMVVATFSAIVCSLGSFIFYRLIDHMGLDFNIGLFISILGGLSYMVFGGALLLYVMSNIKKPK